MILIALYSGLFEN